LPALFFKQRSIRASNTSTSGVRSVSGITGSGFGSAMLDR
jgi:hypothetical protein